MRPPYFDCNDACLGVMNDLSYHIIIASLDTLDWAHQDDIQTSRDIFSNAVNPSNPASDSFLVLEHDVHVNTVRQLVQFMIDTLKAKGYRSEFFSPNAKRPKYPSPVAEANELSTSCDCRRVPRRSCRELV